MEDIFAMLQGLNIPEEEMSKIVASAKEDPMQAFGEIQKYMTPELMQQLMMMAMSNPDVIQGMASEYGIEDEQLNDLTSAINSPE